VRSELHRTLEIGRVARAHVHLDHTLRQTHQAPASPSAAVFLNGGIISTVRLIDDCRVMLDHACLDEVVLQAARAALQAGFDANQDRNRVVHDHWLRDSAQDTATPCRPPSWRAFRVKKGTLGPISTDPPRDLAWVESALDRLQRAQTRTFALLWALFGRDRSTRVQGPRHRRSSTRGWE
jgi:hypothetical protein